MNRSSTKALYSLTNHKDLQAASIDDLQNVVKEYPYFPVAQFLLTRKLKAENSNEYQQQVQKTALFFSNPFWLKYQLDENGNYIIEDEVQVENNIDDLHPITTAFTTEELTAASNLAHETLQETTDEVTSKEEDGEPVAVTEVEPETKEVTSIDVAQVPLEIKEVANNNENKRSTEDQNKEVTPINDSEKQPDEVTAVAEEMAGVSLVIDENVEAFLEEAGKDDGTKPAENLSVVEEMDEHEKMYQNIKAMLDATSEEADANVENAEVPIDPYYTIDYFASQGIKLDFDPNPQDKLGKKLKKFTQWLKHMKKLGPEDSQADVDEGESEADIQQIADSSIVAKEVVTEAMAAVLEKQGKKDKAIELYNKLSFLNPDKTPYFASKIKNLKGY